MSLTKRDTPASFKCNLLLLRCPLGLMFLCHIMPTLFALHNSSKIILTSSLFYKKVVGHLNIDSIRNTFIFAESIVKAFDLFLISESTMDSIFTMNQFHIFGFKVLRRDRNRSYFS